MIKSWEFDRVTSIVLHSMRMPILVLMTVAAVTIIGMVVVPGPVVDGETLHMSFFHALYFLTYTATTTGFGEIPYEFSDAQRLWAMISLYASVIAWVYAIGSIIALLQNPHFKQAVAQRKFARGVSRIMNPFYIVCGFGDTGSLLTRGLTDARLAATVIDSDPNRLQALALRDYPVTVPGLCADAGVPKHLIAAGLQQPNCLGVVALTNDEGINRKIVVMARLLNPSVRAIGRSSSRVEEEFLASLGSVTVVDPFEAFARQLSTALYAPALYTFSEWLVGAPGAALEKPLRPPVGNWILCGFGRMGRRVYAALQDCNVPVVVIDPRVEDEQNLQRKVVGHANARTLRQAGIESAVGVVAATQSDSNNLGILITARTLNPSIFLLVRQNRHDHEVAFEAANADLIMQPSLVTARRILFLLVYPLVEDVLEYMHGAGEQTLNMTIRSILSAVGDNEPVLWTETLATPVGQDSNTFCANGHAVALRDIMREPGDRERAVDCVPLALKREGKTIVLPDGTENLAPGDQILFCATRQAQRLLKRTVADPYALEYAVTGIEEPRGYVMKWLFRRNGARQTLSS